ncbi:MAG: hypothetical protein K0U74_08225 [Alphaproteobacteria bacterium]|nr:hypothetical protein [Alphaproteobacteria bacterium]
MLGEIEPILRFILTLPISKFVSGSIWAYPALETVHLIGLGLLFGPIIIYDLRILGFLRSVTPATLASTLLPWVWTGFALNALSGLLLFASDAVEFGINPAFQAKMALIFLAGLNAVTFQMRYRQSATPAGAQGPSLKIQAAFSILIWLSVIVAGRMIAYVA